jgi:hypothetical protein
MIKNIFIFSFLLFCECFGQTITFDEFIEQANKSLKVNALIGVQNSLPEEINITAEDIGDFSGDGKNDFAIAYRLKTSRDRTIFVNLYCDSLNSYVLVFSDTLEFVDLPIEIAFNISNKLCFITQKLEERSWKIIGYSFYKNELKLVDLYFTDVKQPNKRFEFGEENYTNFVKLPSFIGYFDLNSIEQFKKSNYFIFPVYDLKRNIYNGYQRKISINNYWEWKKDTNIVDRFGTIVFSREKERLIIDLQFDKSLIERLNTAKENVINFYFDRSNKRYLEKIPGNFVKKAPKFRNTDDEDISHFGIVFKVNSITPPRLEYQLGNNYNFSYKDKIKFNVVSETNYNIQMSVPFGIFNRKNIDGEINNFVSFRLFLNDGTVLDLKSSDGSESDPSSYSKLLIINLGDYFGHIVNNKFQLLQQKSWKNGIIKNLE